MLARGRCYPTLATWLFVLLLALVATERRLAEIHFDLRSAGVGLESDDILDGDEIRIRLVVLNDDKLPTRPDAGHPLTFEVVPVGPQRYASRALGVPIPRGPPRSCSSSPDRSRRKKRAP